jgi:hypothetical protein
MTQRKRLPLWQRVVCGVLCVAGLIALGVNMLSGQVHGAVSIYMWFLGLAGAYVFGRAALAHEPQQREVASLPEPSDTVQRFIESGQRTAALKAYRAQAGVSLHEAQSVLASYWA